MWRTRKSHQKSWIGRRILQSLYSSVSSMPGKRKSYRKTMPSLQIPKNYSWCWVVYFEDCAWNSKQFRFEIHQYGRRKNARSSQWHCFWTCLNWASLSSQRRRSYQNRDHHISRIGISIILLRLSSGSPRLLHISTEERSFFKKKEPLNLEQSKF